MAGGISHTLLDMDKVVVVLLLVVGGSILNIEEAKLITNHKKNLMLHA